VKSRRLAATLAATAVITAALSPAALAADQVTQTVNAGTRTASIANLALTAVGYSHAQQTSTGSMTLTADDSSGTGLGWNVTVQSSGFAYSGANSGTAIPAANFALTSAGTPTATAGQAVDSLFGPKVPVVSPAGTLDTARKVVQANVLYGQGTYTQALGVSLTIPAQSRAGTYTGTLTTTATAAP